MLIPAENLISKSQSIYFPSSVPGHKTYASNSLKLTISQPPSSWIFPAATHEQPGGFNFDTFLRGPNVDDLDGPSTDFTAVHQIDGAVTHWATHLGDINPQEIDSADTDESDVEMASDADAIHDNISNGEDQDMVDDDDKDKICYGMVNSLLSGVGNVDSSFPQLYRRDVVLKTPEMSILVARLRELADTNPEHVQKFILTVKPAPHILLSLPDGMSFGILRDDMTKVLKPLLGKCPPYELEAVATTKRLCDQIGMGKPNEAIVQVSINIYGPRDRAKEVGDKLSENRQWLQKPDFSKPQYPYSNPHKLHFPELDSRMVEEEIRKDVSTVAKPRAEEERVQRLVVQVHQALTRANELDNMAGDQRLKTDLLK